MSKNKILKVQNARSEEFLVTIPPPYFHIVINKGGIVTKISPAYRPEIVINKGGVLLLRGGIVTRNSSDPVQDQHITCWTGDPREDNKTDHPP